MAVFFQRLSVSRFFFVLKFVFCSFEFVSGLELRVSCFLRRPMFQKINTPQNFPFTIDKRPATICEPCQKIIFFVKKYKKKCSFFAKNVKKCSIRVSFCHFLHTPKFVLTPYLLTTNDNFPENYCPSCQISNPNQKVGYRY